MQELFMHIAVSFATVRSHATQYKLSVQKRLRSGFERVSEADTDCVYIRRLVAPLPDKLISAVRLL